MLLLARMLPGSPEVKGSFIHLLIQVFIAQALQSRIPACLLFHFHLFLLQEVPCFWITPVSPLSVPSALLSLSRVVRDCLGPG